MSAGLVDLIVAEVREDPDARRRLADALRDELAETIDAGLLTPAQVADRLGVSTRTVNRWASEGRMEAVKVGRGWRLPADRLELAPVHRKPTSGTPAIQQSPRRRHVSEPHREMDPSAALLDLARRGR